jgi:hypothetical protein
MRFGRSQGPLRIPSLWRRVAAPELALGGMPNSALTGPGAGSILALGKPISLESSFRFVARAPLDRPIARRAGISRASFFERSRTYAVHP